MGARLHLKMNIGVWYIMNRRMELPRAQRYFKVLGGAKGTRGARETKVVPHYVCATWAGEIRELFDVMVGLLRHCVMPNYSVFMNLLQRVNKRNSSVSSSMSHPHVSMISLS